MKYLSYFLTIFFVLIPALVSGCHRHAGGGEVGEADTVPTDSVVEPIEPEDLTLYTEDIEITKEFIFEDYLLEDTYPYKDTVRTVKWDTMKEYLARIENMQEENPLWGVFENYRNMNKEAPTVPNYVRNEYGRVSDTLGTERYQSCPLYYVSDSTTPVIYARDGWLARLTDSIGSFYEVHPAESEELWLVPKRYFRLMGDTIKFRHVIFVDRGDQNIATLEWQERGKWLARSTNPATTGRHKPPYAQETPLGIYLLQQQKRHMYYLKDGSSELGGFAPYASRFTNGAYIHGVPVNAPRKSEIEYSPSLGTTPRSHMCVRNATSHAKFVYEWAPVDNALVVVIE